jgi:sugar transport protein
MLRLLPAGTGGGCLALVCFGLLPALALACGIAVLPESPRWLLLHQHKEAALKVLSRILVVDLRDLSTQYPRSGGERRDHGELAQQFSGVTHVSELTE